MNQKTYLYNLFNKIMIKNKIYNNKMNQIQLYLMIKPNNKKIKKL